MSERPATALPRRLGIALAVIPVLAVGLADAVIAVRTHDAAQPPPAVSATHRPASGSRANDNADRAQAISALLHRRSRAIVDHDLTAFLADVDPQQPAFVAQQRRWFDNLAAVPFASYSYSYDPDSDQPATAEEGRYDAPVWAPSVMTVRFAIRGYDTTQTSDREYPTFVRRPQGWVLASYDDFAARGDHNDVEIWDFGPVRVARAKHVLALGHPVAATGLLQQVADETSLAIPRVDEVWHRAWAGRVVVEVPSTQHELSRLVGAKANLSQIAAVASAEVQDCPGPPNPVGSRVAINPRNWPKLSELGRRIVLTHELTHVATRADTGSCTPTWLVEGFADYVGYRGSGIAVPVIAQELAADVRAGHVPAQLPKDADFDGGNDRLAQAYEGAWLACRMIAERWGERMLVRLYTSVGRAPEPAAALGDQLSSLLGMTKERFVATWQDYLRAQLS